MGWNDVEPVRSDRLFDHVTEAPRFYFLHSFVLHCSDQNHVLATTTYGEEFCCAVNSNNVYGVQFHPEKSHQFGTALLKGFAGTSRA
jgi:glutamine amidotransferase